MMGVRLPKVLAPDELQEIIRPVEVSISTPEPISFVLLDSRSCSTVREVLFVSIRTSTGDGHQYIQALYELGVRHFLIEHPIESYRTVMPLANWYRVDSSIDALQTLAGDYRDSLSYPIVGITGSNGKTIVKEFIYQLLSPEIRISRSPRSYNSQIGVPLSLLSLEPDAEVGLIEAGISQPEEMASLQAIIKPDIGIFTGIGPAHDEYFASEQDKIREKFKLFSSCRQLVLSLDNEEVRAELQRTYPNLSIYGWSYANTNALIYVRSKVVQGAETIVSLIYQDQRYTLRFPFTDRAYTENILLALTFVAAYYPEYFPAREQLLQLKPIEMRLEVKDSFRGNTLINDAYSLDLNSLQIALDFQRRRTQVSGQQSVVVLSDFSQTGIPPEELYGSVGKMLRRYGVDYLIGVGADISVYASYINTPHSSYYLSTQELLASNIFEQFTGSCILLKGGRDFAFERISHSLSLSQHQTILEVNLSQVRRNIAVYRQLLPRETNLVCMIKADGYGIGALEIARALEAQGIDYLAVAVADEGKYLRMNGIKCRIMIMNPELNSSDTLFDYALEPEVYGFELLMGLIREAGQRGLQNYPIHIKLDTGMHRLGFLSGEIPELARLLRTEVSLRVQSIFSHLATADEPSKDQATWAQITAFEELTDELIAGLGYRPWLHMLNTAGIERFSGKAPFDMARLGIGLYGFSPYQVSGVESIFRLRTTILQTKLIPAGQAIGYGAHGRRETDRLIAILPIGYADGFSRRLGQGRYEVLVGGILCPTVGNICMDSCMIDITECPTAKVGDSVLLLGSPERPVELIAQAMDTISYEVITSLGSRIQRIYYSE